MRKHFLLFLLCLATNASLTAQETLRENNGEPTLVERLSDGEIKINSAEMNFQLFTSANAEFVGNELDGMNFKLNRVRLEIKGDVASGWGIITGSRSTNTPIPIRSTTSPPRSSWLT